MAPACNCGGCTRSVGRYSDLIPLAIHLIKKDFYSSGESCYGYIIPIADSPILYISIYLSTMGTECKNIRLTLVSLSLIAAGWVFGCTTKSSDAAARLVKVNDSDMSPYLHKELIINKQRTSFAAALTAIAAQSGVSVVSCCAEDMRLDTVTIGGNNPYDLCSALTELTRGTGYSYEICNYLVGVSFFALSGKVTGRLVNRVTSQPIAGALISRIGSEECYQLTSKDGIFDMGGFPYNKEGELVIGTPERSDTVSVHGGLRVKLLF